MSSAGAAGRIASLIEKLLGHPFPLAIRTWDGAHAGPDSGPTLVVHSRRALRRVLWQPDEVGLARGWVAGEIDVEGDLEEALRHLDAIVEALDGRPRLTPAERADVIRLAVTLGAVGPPLKAPPEEVDLGGERHSKHRDHAAVTHHYDVGNDFFETVLGPSMVYSCAYWAGTGPDYGLDEAQRDKHDLVCRKLDLQPGMRLLDVGCGWGSLALHAAREYGARAVGVTLSAPQAEYAQRRVADAGLTDLVEIRNQDWRDVDDGPYDAVASVGMAEHLGAERWPDYVARLYDVLRPGGRLLNHQIVSIGARRGTSVRGSRTFVDAYVFPDGHLTPVGDVLNRLEGGGFEVRDVHALRENYARTLRAWAANLEAGWKRAVDAATRGRARVWKLYMTGSALSFDAGRIGIDQVLAVRPGNEGRSDVPMVRPVGWSS